MARAFPDGWLLEKEFGGVYVKLKQKGIDRACNRLDQLDKDIESATIASSLGALQQHLPDTDTILQDVEDARSKGTKRLSLWRALFALAPLLVTWVSLSWATFLYQQTLVENQKQQSVLIQPFLSLWQSGFEGSIPWFTFANVAALDFILISIVSVLTWRVHAAEGRSLKLVQEVEPDLRAALQHLSIAIERRTQFNPTNPQDWARAAKDLTDAVQKAMDETKQLADEGRNVVTTAQATITQISADHQTFMRDFAAQVPQVLQAQIQAHQDFIRQAGQDLHDVLDALVAANSNLINTQMKPLLQDYQKTLQDFTTQVTQYKAASANLVTEVGNLTTAATSLGSLTGVAKHIDDHLVAANKTQQDFVNQVSGAAKDMKDAADAVRPLATLVSRDIKDQVKAMSQNVVDASDVLRQAQGELKTASSHLSIASGELHAASADLRAASGGLRGGPRRRRHRWWPF